MPVTAAEALEHIYSHNQKKRTEFPSELRDALPPVYIFSLYDEPFRRDLGNMGSWRIPAKEKDEEYSKPVVVHGMNPSEYDLADGAGNMGLHFVTGEKLANAILGLDSSTPKLDLLTTNIQWFGVFTSKSNPPKKAEIVEAKKKLDQMMTMLLQHGDKLAASGQNGIAMIGAQHRKACAYKNQTRDWAKTPVTLENCPVCASPIHPGVAFCVTCKSVLDPVRWAQFQPKNEKATA